MRGKDGKATATLIQTSLSRVHTSTGRLSFEPIGERIRATRCRVKRGFVCLEGKRTDTLYRVGQAAQPPGNGL